MTTAALQASGRVRGSVLFNSSGALVSFRREEVPWWAVPLWYLFNEVVLGDVWGPRFYANFKTRDNVTQILKQVRARPPPPRWCACHACFEAGRAASAASHDGPLSSLQVATG
jgi:hypothetical protein